MTCCFGDSSDSEPDGVPLGNLNPLIQPTVRRAAVPRDTTVVTDPEGNVTVDVPESANSAGASGLELTRNLLGGFQIRGNARNVVARGDTITITDDNGQVHTLERRRGSNQEAESRTERSNRPRRNPTTRNRHPAQRTQRGGGEHGADRPSGEFSSLKGSSAGPVGSIESDRNARHGQADDTNSVAGTLVGEEETQRTESIIGGSFHSSGWSSGYTRVSSAVPTTAASDGTHVIIGEQQNNHFGPDIQINGNVTNFYGNHRGVDVRGRIFNDHGINGRNDTR